MAIAGLFAIHAPQSQSCLMSTLRGMSPILDLNPVDKDKLAITLEIKAEELTGFLKKISDHPDIFNLELIFVNYEDDLDTEGFMVAPPEARKYD